MDNVPRRALLIVPPFAGIVIPEAVNLLVPQWRVNLDVLFGDLRVEREVAFIVEDVYTRTDIRCIWQFPR